MNDLLDDRLRTMMRTATADAPEAPTVDDLQAITVVGAEPRQRSLRPVAAAAAVVALIGTGALVWWSTGDDGQVPADETDTTEAAPTPGAYLDAYYLPTDLPDGWHIVQLRREPAGEAYTGNSAVFVRRDDPSVRGVASFSPGSVGAPATTAAEVAGESVTTLPTDATTARWDPDLANLSWAEGDRDAFVVTTNRVEPETRELAEALVVVASATGPTFDVAADSSWVKVKDYQLDGAATPSSGVNSLTIGRDEFTAVSFNVLRWAGPKDSEWAAPTGIGDVHEAAAPNGQVTFSRQIGELTIEASLTSPPPDVRDLVIRVLADMREVSVAEWQAALPDITAALTDSPVVASFDLMDHVVTLRQGGPFSGICVDRSDGARGCTRLSFDASAQLPDGFANNVVLDDGSWVAVGAIPDSAVMCDVASLSDATAAIADNSGQQLVLFLPGPDTQDGFNCNLGGESDFGWFFVPEFRPEP